MGVTVRNFLGRELTLPDDRSYEPEEGLWVRETGDGRLAVGLAEPTVLMVGGVREVELLVEEGEDVAAGQTVCLLLTSKLRYLGSPVGGVVQRVATGPEVNDDPYGVPLFFVSPTPGQSAALADAATYARKLAQSEGARNPEGKKGGVSSICKAVYWGIGQQKLKE
ncbi:MAG: hypothetical protein Kow0092_27820 [Deferrisomatales bacterium]